MKNLGSAPPRSQWSLDVLGTHPAEEDAPARLAVVLRRPLRRWLAAAAGLIARNVSRLSKNCLTDIC